MATISLVARLSNGSNVTSTVTISDANLARLSTALTSSLRKTQQQALDYILERLIIQARALVASHERSQTPVAPLD